MKVRKKTIMKRLLASRHNKLVALIAILLMSGVGSWLVFTMYAATTNYRYGSAGSMWIDETAALSKVRLTSGMKVTVTWTFNVPPAGSPAATKYTLKYITSLDGGGTCDKFPSGTVTYGPSKFGTTQVLGVTHCTVTKTYLNFFYNYQVTASPKNQYSSYMHYAGHGLGAPPAPAPNPAPSPKPVPAPAPGPPGGDGTGEGDGGDGDGNGPKGTGTGQAPGKKPGNSPTPSPSTGGGGGGGSSATKQTEKPTPIPKTAPQGEKQEPTKIEPSPFYDGKEYKRGSDTDNFALGSTTVGSRKVPNLLLYALAILFIAGTAGTLYWRRKRKGGA